MTRLLGQEGRYGLRNPELDGMVHRRHFCRCTKNVCRLGLYHHLRSGSLSVLRTFFLTRQLYEARISNTSPRNFHLSIYQKRTAVETSSDAGPLKLTAYLSTNTQRAETSSKIHQASPTQQSASPFYVRQFLLPASWSPSISRKTKDLIERVSVSSSL